MAAYGEVVRTVVGRRLQLLSLIGGRKLGGVLGADVHDGVLTGSELRLDHGCRVTREVMYVSASCEFECVGGR